MKRTVATMLTLLLLCTAVVAQEAEEKEKDWLKAIDKKLAMKVTVNFENTPLYEALDYFRKRADLNVILDAPDPKLRERRVTLKLNDVRLESGIAWTARLLGMEYALQDEAVYVTPRDNMPDGWRAQMQERYQSQVASGQESWITLMEKHLDEKIKVEFRNQPLSVVAEVLAIQGRVNIVLDSELEGGEKRVTLNVEMSLKNIIDWVCRLAEVKYAIRDQVIYIASAERLEALRLETGESALALIFRRPVSYDFKDTPLDDALGRLSRLTRVDIDLQGVEKGENLTVTLKGEKVELNRAVRAVMEEVKKKTGRAYAISHRGTSILVVLPSEKKKAPGVTSEKKE